MSDGPPIVVLSTTVDDREVVIGVFGPVRERGRGR